VTAEGPETEGKAGPVEPGDRAAGLEFAKRVLAEAAQVQPVPDSELGAGSTDLHAPVHPLSTVEVATLFADQVVPASDQSVAEVLGVRRSQRIFHSLPAAELVTVLQQVFTLQGFAPADDGGVRRFRPVPSAGGRHPVVPLVLIEDVLGLDRGLWRFDADADLLHLVAPYDHEDLARAWDGACAAGEFDRRPPAVVILAARFDATLARYPHGSSLVWRDAGVALGYLHLSAASHGLNSCILGTSGLLDETLLAACGMTGQVVGDVGGMAVGRS
jgi:SagB-type dehydrogenase family enzyme